MLSEKEQKYKDALLRARNAENDAIAIGLELILYAPAKDLPQITEIANDENDHDRIYVDILARYMDKGGGAT